jgi:DNA-binding transcriptional LysR family regulator
MGAGIPSWDAMRVFLEVARHGSFRAASQHLDTSINALRHQVTELENRVGLTLMTRHVDGIRVTAEGREVLQVAQRMEMASLDLRRAFGQSDTNMAGEVRLAITEGLGTFWITPRLVEFQRAFPKLLIDMRCAMQSADVLRMEADMSVQLTRPAALDLKIVKIGRLHAMPFAAQSYLDRHGTPSCVSDLVNHRIVLQVAEHLASVIEYERLFHGIPQPGFVAIRSNVSSAHYWSVAKGAGIGMLPTYSVALGAPVIPLDIGLRHDVDIWLTYHPDVGRIPRLRQLLDWVIDAFDSKKFPWFSDEFIHPHELPRMLAGVEMMNMFAGFSSEHVNAGTDK